MKGWTWQFGTLAIAIGISGWLAYANVTAALGSGASDALAYSIIADAVLFFFGAAFWHYHALGRNIGCVMLAIGWLAGASYVGAANTARLEGQFRAAWAPVVEATAQEDIRIHGLEDSLKAERDSLKDAQTTALHDPKQSIRDNASKQAVAIQARIAELESERAAVPKKASSPAVKHFLIGYELAVPIGLLILAQIALWATFGADAGEAKAPPLPRSGVQVDQPVDRPVAQVDRSSDPEVIHQENRASEAEIIPFRPRVVHTDDPAASQSDPLAIQVKTMAGQGASQRKIASELNISRAKVQRYLGCVKQ